MKCTGKRPGRDTKFNYKRFIYMSQTVGNFTSMNCGRRAFIFQMDRQKSYHNVLCRIWIWMTIKKRDVVFLNNQMNAKGYQKVQFMTTFYKFLKKVEIRVLSFDRSIHQFIL